MCICMYFAHSFRVCINGALIATLISHKPSEPLWKHWYWLPQLRSSALPQPLISLLKERNPPQGKPLAFRRFRMWCCTRCLGTWPCPWRVGWRTNQKQTRRTHCLRNRVAWEIPLLYWNMTLSEFSQSGFGFSWNSDHCAVVCPRVISGSRALRQVALLLVLSVCRNSINVCHSTQYLLLLVKIHLW